MGVITSSGNTVVNSGAVTATMSGAVNAATDYSDFISVQRISTSGVGTYTVPAGKRWVITSWGCYYNGGASYIRFVSVTVCYNTALNDYSGSLGGQLYLLESAEAVSITRSGWFTYKEIDNP